MSSSSPIVILDIGGVREVVKDESAGRIVARNADAIVAAARDLLRARQTRQTLPQMPRGSAGNGTLRISSRSGGKQPAAEQSYQATDSRYSGLGKASRQYLVSLIDDPFANLISLGLAARKLMNPSPSGPAEKE